MHSLGRGPVDFDCIWCRGLFLSPCCRCRGHRKSSRVASQDFFFKIKSYGDTFAGIHRKSILLGQFLCLVTFLTGRFQRNCQGTWKTSCVWLSSTYQRCLQKKGNAVFQRKHRKMTEAAYLLPFPMYPALHIWVRLCVPGSIPRIIWTLF